MITNQSPGCYQESIGGIINSYAHRKKLNMIEELKIFFEQMRNPASDFSLEEIRKKFGDSFLKPQAEINKITSEFYNNSKFTPKINCMYPGCTNNPINSHSIQKSLFSSLVDDTNHVLMLKTKFTHKERPSASMKRVGVNEATTFPGLCEKHDETLFADIEKKEIDFNNPYHNFLVAYRALLYENYAKIHSYENIKNIAKNYSNSGNPDQFTMTALSIMAYSHYLGMFYTSKVKSLLDIPLLNKQYNSELFFGVKILSFQLPLFLSSIFTPSYDFEEKIINKFDDSKISPNYFFLSILPSKSETYIFYSILKRQKNNFGNIFSKLNQSSDEDILIYLSELIIRYTENFVISPDYWNRFPEYKKQNLIKYFNDTARNPKIEYNHELHNIFEYVIR